MESFLNDSIMYGISLNELYRELNHKVYPATVNQPNLRIENIKKRHHQKVTYPNNRYCKGLFNKKN